MVPVDQRSQTAEAAANLTVGNIITTLRTIGQLEWSDLIEPVSCSLRVLRQLPSFGRESEGTRQQITHAMESLANELINRGASRSTTEAKVFGGGAVIGGMTSLNIGQRAQPAATGGGSVDLF